jgi:hypothetical protein
MENEDYILLSSKSPTRFANNPSHRVKNLDFTITSASLALQTSLEIINDTLGSDLYPIHNSVWSAIVPPSPTWSSSSILLYKKANWSNYTQLCNLKFSSFSLLSNHIDYSIFLHLTVASYFSLQPQKNILSSI